MAVAPPNGAHTDSRARGRPPLGNTLSSSTIPVATRSEICAPPVRGVASGNRSWIRARKAATDVAAIRVDKGQEVYPNENRKQEGIYGLYHKCVGVTTTVLARAAPTPRI